MPSAAVADTRLLVRSLLAGGVDREALARLDAVSSGRPSALRLRQGFALLVGWGAAVAYAREARPDVDIAGLYLAGAGIGACVAIAVQRLGVEADALGAALTVVVAGAILAFADAVPGSL